MTDVIQHDGDRDLDHEPEAPAAETVQGPAPSELEQKWEQAADCETWPRTRRRSHRATLARIAAAVVTLALVAALVLALLRIRHDDQLASARSSALAAGSSDAALIATYSYSDFGAYTRRVEAASTPQFSANFKTDSSSLGSVLSQYKAGSTGSVSGAGLGSVTTSKATVYVFLNEKVTNSKEAGTTERARMVVTLVRGRGRWLMANAVVQ